MCRSPPVHLGQIKPSCSLCCCTDSSVYLLKSCNLVLGLKTWKLWNAKNKTTVLKSWSSLRSFSDSFIHSAQWLVFTTLPPSPLQTMHTVRSVISSHTSTLGRKKTFNSVSNWPKLWVEVSFWASMFEHFPADFTRRVCDAGDRKTWSLLVIFDNQSVVNHEFIPQGETVNMNILWHLCDNIQQKQPEWLSAR